MSIIVKGIELPEKVQVLELHHDGKVFTRKGYLVGEAVELPDKHGRLVDADALIIDLMERGLEGIQTDDWAEIQQTVMEQPTIVEAEDSE